MAQAGKARRAGAPHPEASPKAAAGSMYRAPRFERGGCRRESCREYQFTGMWLNPNSRGSRLLAGLSSLKPAALLMRSAHVAAIIKSIRFVSAAEVSGGSRATQLVKSEFLVKSAFALSRTCGVSFW